MPSSDIHDGDGIFCPGGSYANMLAMLCARDKFLPGSGKVGLNPSDNPFAIIRVTLYPPVLWMCLMQKGLISYSGPELVSFTSAQSHYSIQRASAALGLGSENVVKVSCDQDGRMIPSELGKSLDVLFAEVKKCLYLVTYFFIYVFVLKAERLLKETIANGKLPFFVNATAGTTVRLSQICIK